MTTFYIHFVDSDVSLKAEVLSKQAPSTTEAFVQALSEPIETAGTHAMYTGREISIQLPVDACQDSKLHDPAKENLTCFPTPGDILFTFMPAYAWGGNPSPIYDFGLFYGKEARTFFPAGWLPGNLFARVVKEDLEELEEMGRMIHIKGRQKVILSLE